MFSFGRMSSYRGPLPPLNPDQLQLAKRLHDHVWLLAGDIGARSLTSAPENLERAAGYIEHVLKTSGFEPEREEFTVEVMSQRNVEISSTSVKFPSEKHKTWNVVAEMQGALSEIVIVGAHYDSLAFTRKERTRKNSHIQCSVWCFPRPAISFLWFQTFNQDRCLGDALSLFAKK